MTADQTAEGLVKALTPQEIDTLNTFYGLFSKRDYSVIEHILAPDWQDIPLGPGQKDGPEGYKGLVQGFTEAFPDVTVNVHEIFAIHEFHHLKNGRLEKTWHLEDWLTMLLETGAWPAKSN